MYGIQLQDYGIYSWEILMRWKLGNQPRFPFFSAPLLQLINDFWYLVFEEQVPSSSLTKRPTSTQNLANDTNPEKVKFFIWELSHSSLIHVNSSNEDLLG